MFTGIFAAKASVGKTLSYNKGGCLDGEGVEISMRGKERMTAFRLPLTFLMRFRDHCITNAGMNSYGDQLHKQLEFGTKSRKND